MASIKVKFRPSTVADREGTIYYQIIHERKVRQLLSAYHVLPAEWDTNRSIVVTTHKNSRKSHLLIIRERIARDVERLTRIGRKLTAGVMAYSVDDIVDEFNRYSSEYSLFNYMERIIVKLKRNGKVRTSEAYKSAQSSFRKFLCDDKCRDMFLGEDDVMLDCLTSDTMEAYEAWLKARGISPNTISFYIRIFRAVYNRAVEEGITDNRNIFRHVYTGIEKTVKRALPLSAIKKIRILDLSLTPAIDFARDMFMMSFYLRGMSFIDMAFLRKSDLQNGYIVYRRRKTGQLLTIEWTREMQMIFDKYPENASVYLLPIIKSSATNERYCYRNAGYNINHNLKKVAEMLGINFRLTMYVARHSWASAAKAKGIPLSVISEGMGHDSETTTQIYLASLDTSVVDKANSLILRALK
ncbi:MAG: site-specific integrase [Muribaculaceae bacterium]|nr:site-specific integrase [Muribaculaceae bacterium]